MKHPCKCLEDGLNPQLRQWAYVLENPASIISYNEYSNQYYFAITNSGSHTHIPIHYCPWCGVELPITDEELGL